MTRKLAMILSLPLLITGCADTCKNTIVSRTASPDHSHEAVLFQRDCGGSTRISTRISVQPAGQAVSATGNAFAADDNRGAAHNGDWGGPWAEARWLANDELLIRYANKSILFRQENRVGTVSVSYRSIAP